MVGLTNIVNNVLSGAAVARGWEGVDVTFQELVDVTFQKPPMILLILHPKNPDPSTVK